MRRLLLTSCMTAALLCPPAMALAEDSSARVNVRTGTHDGYSRIVFDWGAPVTYTVTSDGKEVVEITFQKPGLVDSSAVDIANAKTIRGFEKISGDGENLKVRLKIPDGSKFRDFNVGNKMIIDVYGDVSADTPPKPVEKKAEATPAKTKAVEPEKKDVKEQPAPAPAKVADRKMPDVPAVPVAVIDDLDKKPAKVPDAPVSAVPPHTILISSTNTMGIAVFQRDSHLWIVIDRSDVSVPPQLTGPNKDLFPPFEKIDIKGGIAYRTRMPDGLNVVGDGGGLVWNLTVSATADLPPPIDSQRRFSAGEDIRGGTLFWPMQRVTRVFSIKDPDIGDTILVGTVDNAKQLAGPKHDFVDLTELRSPIGIAIVPKVDDVTMKPLGNGVQVTRPGGLALTRMRDLPQGIDQQKTDGLVASNPDSSVATMRRIFDFDRWLMGGLQAMRDNQQILLSGMAAKDKTGRAQDLLVLAKMNMANDRGQEAVGFLNFAAAELPEIEQSPEFLALRGAAEAMAGKFEMALTDLSTPSLRDYGELDYWRAYTLASLDDWQQAKEFMPKDFDLLQTYPIKLQERLALKLIELALRSGNVGAAKTILTALDKDRSSFQPWTQAGLDYLSGERHRQEKEIKKAESLWLPLTKGGDDLYRAKASLALTMLQLQNKEITHEKAIDNLEGLRYHWRGDEMEARVNYMLGKMYLEDMRYQKGFSILKDAIGMSPDSDISREIASHMLKSFKDLFLGDQLYKISPVDAATLYEDFSELIPPGDEGNLMTQRLAERLVDADLLDRAAVLMKKQVDTKLTGLEAADVAVRLSAIQLLNDDSKSALMSLDKAVEVYTALPPSPEIEKKLRNISLLRARALSKLKKVDDALAILNKLPPAPDVNRLRADIAWNAGLWPDSAAALQDLIIDEGIDGTRPLTQKQADLLLNRAVALNLSGDRVALSNMKTKYDAVMSKTARAKMFEVVTRQRTGSLSSDRESIAALVSEVDMFREFLDSYRAETKPSN